MGQGSKQRGLNVVHFPAEPVPQTDSMLHIKGRLHDKGRKLKQHFSQRVLRKFAQVTKITTQNEEESILWIAVEILWPRTKGTKYSINIY